MNYDLTPDDPAKLLAECKPSAVPTDLMQRLRAACPAVDQANLDEPIHGRRFWWMPYLAAAASLALGIYMYQGTSAPVAEQVASVENTKAAKSSVKVSRSKSLLKTEVVAVGVRKDGRPYKVVKGSWVDVSQIQVDGRPEVWTVAKGCEGVGLVDVDIY